MSKWIPYEEWLATQEFVRGAGVYPVGSRIKVESGNTYLVGDINREGGQCSCCGLYHESDPIEILLPEESTDAST